MMYKKPMNCPKIDSGLDIRCNQAENSHCYMKNALTLRAIVVSIGLTTFICCP
jgi:hypothetical protein